MPTRIHDWPELDVITNSWGRNAIYFKGNLAHRNYYRVPLINLFRDRRGGHLEAALDDIATSRWAPFGFNQADLRRVYAAIVDGLHSQLGPDRYSEKRIEPLKPTAQRECPSFDGLEVEYWMRSPRLATHDLNIIVEAILSTWTASPIPSEAGSHERTILIAQFLGWSLRDINWLLRRPLREGEAPSIVYETAIRLLPPLAKARALQHAHLAPAHFFAKKHASHLRKLILSRPHRS